MISPPRIRTNEDSSKDILPKHILAVSQKLGPNIDTQLAKTSLSASISKNVTHACNLYLLYTGKLDIILYYTFIFF